MPKYRINYTFKLDGQITIEAPTEKVAEKAFGELAESDLLERDELQRHADIDIDCIDKV